MADDALDLDALIASVPKPKEEPGRLEALRRGATQGATVLFGDEITGAVAAPILKLALGRIADRSVRLTPQAEAEAKNLGIDVPARQEVPGMGELYKQVRNDERAKDAAAQDAHQGYYLGGNVGGGLLTSRLIPGVGSARITGQLAKMGARPALAALGGRLGASLLNGLLQGGVFGGGASEASDLGQFAGDVGRGSLLGGGIGLGAGAVGEGLQALSGSLGRRVEALAQRAKDMAEKQEGKVTSAATGTAGAATQAANRLVENIQRLRSLGNLNPEQTAALDAMQGQLAHLEQQLGASSIKALPEAAARKEAADALAQEAVATHPERVASATEDLLSPKTAGKQALALAKRYWPVVAGEALGHVLHAVPGVGGLAGRALSPSIHAVIRRASHPAVQRLLALGGQKAASGLATALGAASKSPAAVAAPAELKLIPAMSTPATLPAVASSDPLDDLIAEALGQKALQQGVARASQ